MKDGQFSISVYISVGEHQTYFVEHIPVSRREEHFFVRRAGETMILSSNRPLFRSKGLKHRRGDYQLLSDQLHNIGLLNRIIDAIEAKKELWDKDSLPPPGT